MRFPLPKPADGDSVAPVAPAAPVASIALGALLAALAGAPAVADTLASSAISNSFSASVGSVSTSFNASSDASSPGRPMRTGEYRIMQIAAAPEREGYARLTLRTLDAAGGVGGVGEAAAADDHHLYLPQETVARAALAEGQRISARARPYGLELAKAATPEEVPQTFFLVVADERYRELQTRPVTL